MEVDWTPTQEVKETSDGASLDVGGSSDGRAEDFPMQPADGQMQISS